MSDPKKTKEQSKKVDKSEKEKEEKEKQIAIAVKFLSNPEIASASDSAKKAFLKKKGLTDEDIEKVYLLKKEKEEEAAKAVKPV